MIRFIAACSFAALLLLSTCASAVFMPKTLRVGTATASTAMSLRDLDYERQRSLALRNSLADRSQAEEALRTLDQLQRLYQHEEQLWSYYEALHSSAMTRQSMLEQRLQLERLLQEQQQMQEQLNKKLNNLRPPQDNTITFNN